MVKVRRILEGEHQGQHLIAGYLFDDLDYVDSQLLRFLQTTKDRVRQLLGESADNGEAHGDQ